MQTSGLHEKEGIPVSRYEKDGVPVYRREGDMPMSNAENNMEAVFELAAGTKDEDELIHGEQS